MCLPKEKPVALSRYAENGVFTPAKIAGALRTTRDEIAQTAGLGRDAILRRSASPPRRRKSACARWSRSSTRSNRGSDRI